MSAPQTTGKSNTQTLGVGILVIIWITSIFIIVVLNDIRNELRTIKERSQSVVSQIAQLSPGSYQIMDKDGAVVVYQIQRIPEPEIPADDMETAGTTTTP